MITAVNHSELRRRPNPPGGSVVVQEMVRDRDIVLRPAFGAGNVLPELAMDEADMSLPGPRRKQHLDLVWLTGNQARIDGRSARLPKGARVFAGFILEQFRVKLARGACDVAAGGFRQFW